MDEEHLDDISSDEEVTDEKKVVVDPVSDHQHINDHNNICLNNEAINQQDANDCIGFNKYVNTQPKLLLEDFNSNLNEISSDESETEKPQNGSLWIGEPKKWQQITAADFEEIRELSDTDDEFNSANLTVSETKYWSQSVVPTKYYVRNSTGGHVGTSALNNRQQEFVKEVLDRINEIKDAQPRSEPPTLPEFHSCSSCNHQEKDSISSDDAESESENSDDSSESDSSLNNELNCLGRKRIKQTKKPLKSVHKDRPSKQSLMAKNAIERKQNHPAGLHSDVCFNEVGQINDGPFCKCSWASKQTGVRHNKFAGECSITKCNLNESNSERLYHYVLQVTPNPNKFTRSPTVIDVDGIEYVFDGFSVFFHQPLPDTFPQSPMNQWNLDFVVKFERENSPESFTIKDLELFHTYLFDNIMEMYDLDRIPNAQGNSCFFYHCMPRFVRFLKDDGKEILPMSSVLKYFTDCFIPFADDYKAVSFCKDFNFLLETAQTRKGRLFINPAKKPMCIRVDLIDRHDLEPGHDDFYPLFTHFGIRPSAYTYNGKPEYQRALKRFIKLRHLLSLKARLNSEDRQKLRDSEEKLKRLRAECKTKRDISICVSSRGFYETGIYPDIVQHAMFLILACSHVRFHWSLRVYEEERIKYKFKNRVLLELALTHPSYRSNYGTNPDHAKNTLNNCGIIQTKVRGAKNDINMSSETKSGNSRKRGITALMEIMSMQGSKKAVKTSLVNHNERLEFMGDAVVEFISTVHLFFMFPEADEGVLATYRSALVQNKHLASLAKKIGLHEFMLYAHGPDLCHEADLRHAMANAFEAMMAAVFLDSNINECDRIFSQTLYGDNEELLNIWSNLPDHELKTGNPFGDRHKIEEIACLRHLTEFEEKIGVKFKYIRVLAKALTRRNIDFNYLTFGHNQRLEFLGDTVLQLITTDYLYKHFPMHQEGHLSLLRTCLVSNKTQSVICDDLAMQKYLIVTKKAERSGKTNTQLRVKDKADLVESFLGALYVDRGLQYCKIFCRVCFFPRLKYFILTQRWNDPKSQLQQCCLTLRQAESGEPDIPEYKTIGVEGPTNTRVYRVAVYFRNKRLAEGVGSSVQLAQMQAAENALIEKAELFPSFDFRNTYLGARNGEQNEEAINVSPKANNALKNRKRKRANNLERISLNLNEKRKRNIPSRSAYDRGNERNDVKLQTHLSSSASNTAISSLNIERNSSIGPSFKKSTTSSQNEKFFRNANPLPNHSKYEGYTNGKYNKFLPTSRFPSSSNLSNENIDRSKSEFLSNDFTKQSSSSSSTFWPSNNGFGSFFNRNSLPNLMSSSSSSLYPSGGKSHYEQFKQSSSFDSQLQQSSTERHTFQKTTYERKSNFPSTSAQFLPGQLKNDGFRTNKDAKPNHSYYNTMSNSSNSHNKKDDEEKNRLANNGNEPPIRFF